VVYSQLSQMKRYDAQAIARHYRRRPWRVLVRFVQVLVMLGSFWLALQRDRWFKQEERNREQRAAQLRQLLTRLGPTFIKVGQALSTRPDLIRPDFLEELIKLQDQLPPFPTAMAWAIIERELGLTPEEIYSFISPEPVAAASLGQVLPCPPLQWRRGGGEGAATEFAAHPHLRSVPNALGRQLAAVLFAVESRP
jgi:predicted unusual protein kinase regulating ubiquinone biosynthesis (AarF/ABC1/UbiB family)